jgi:hypothetical protein
MPEDHLLQGAWITSREIYEAVVRLTGRVDVLIEQQTHIRLEIEELKKDLRDHEDRLRILERGRWPLPALAAVVAIASLALAVFGLINPQ